MLLNLDSNSSYLPLLYEYIAKLTPKLSLLLLLYYNSSAHPTWHFCDIWREMPERNFDALDIDRRKKAIEYVPGYDWVPGKFGPPPGIPKARKDEFGT